jgi:hypothetical protein
MRAILVGLLVLSSAGPAAAQSATQRAIILYREANIHYNMGKFKLAADKYLAAIRADPSIPGPYRNLGLTYRSMDKCDLALAYFRKYLALQPTSKHSDRVRKEIEYCAAKTGQRPDQIPVGAAQLVIRCSLEGAQVHIDGVLRGSTPSPAFPVQPGKHTINVYRSGYLPWHGSVNVVEGQAVALEVKLKPDPKVLQAKLEQEQRRQQTVMGKSGQLKVIGLPRTAQLTADGLTVALDDDDTTRLGVGVRKLKITGRGLEPWSSEVTIEEGKTTTVIPELKLTYSAKSLRRWAWISTGAAVVLGIVGGALGLAENATFEEIRDYDRQAGTRADLNELVDKRRTQGLVSNIMFGLAGAALSAGVVLFTIAPEVERPSQQTRTTSFSLKGGVTF